MLVSFLLRVVNTSIKQDSYIWGQRLVIVLEAFMISGQKYQKARHHHDVISICQICSIVNLIQQLMRDIPVNVIPSSPAFGS